nr:hypothetical protein [Gemmatimonadaceae bacterium]
MQPQAPAAPPAPPPPPATEARILVDGNKINVPRSAAEVRALRERRDMLSSQLSSVKERRDETASEMRGAVP